MRPDKQRMLMATGEGVDLSIIGGTPALFCSLAITGATMSHPRTALRPFHTAASALLLLAACMLPVRAADAPATTLKQAYANDFLIGTAVNDDIVSGKDAASQALVLKHFNAITLENAMKAEVVHPLPD